MTGHIVVGYTATKQGRDAVAFASRLAAATGAVLDIAIILPNSERSVITPPDASYDRYLHAQAQQWIAHAIDRIPAEVVAHAKDHPDISELHRRVAAIDPRIRFGD